MRNVYSRFKSFSIGPARSFIGGLVGCFVLLAVILTISGFPVVYSQESREVRVGVYDNPPISYEEQGGKYKGLSVEVLEHIASHEGWSLEYVPGTWHECLERLENGEIDIQVYIAYSKERARKYDFTNETLFSNWGVVFCRPGSDIDSILDLNQKTVALYKGATHNTAFRKLTEKLDLKCKIIEVDSNHAVLSLVEEKKADAGVVNRVFGATRARNYSINKTSIIFNPIEVRYAVPKGKNHDLVIAIDKRLAAMKRDKGSIYYLALAKTFGTIGGPVIPRWAIWTLASSIGLLLIVVFGNMVLRRQVKLKTAELSMKNRELGEENTRRKQIEETLKEKEERIRLALDGTDDGIWDWNVATGEIRLDDNWIRILGYEPGEAKFDFKWWERSTHPESFPVFEEALNDYLEGRKAYYEIEYRIRTKLDEWKWIWARGTCVAYDEQGKPLRMIGTHRDITERKQIEEDLIESKERLSYLSKATFEGIAIHDRGVVLEANDQFFDMFGYEPDELVGKQAIPLTIAPESREVLKKHISSGSTTPYEAMALRKDGTKFPMEIHIRQMQYQGRPVRVAVIRDISERRRAEAALRESEERFRNAFDHAALGMVLVSTQGRFLRVNPYFCQMLGYTEEELLNKVFNDVTHPDDYDVGLEVLRKVVDGTSPYAWAEKRYLHKDGHVVWGMLSTSLVRDAAGKPLYLVSHIQDNTERKRAEDQIKASLKEKEVLLREIHHRVKNNFQIVSSLLDMIKMRTRNQEAIDLLTDARSKIYTMALVHTQLYEGERFDRIDMEKHIRQLVNHLSQVYSARGRSINPVIQPSDVHLTVNQAIPCALVLNEVVSNAFKHAFRERDQGKVEISMRYSADHTVIIRVKDDGIGIPEEVDIEKTQTLGLKLAKNLVESQLKGEIQVKRDNGTEVIIEFKAQEEEVQHGKHA